MGKLRGRAGHSLALLALTACSSQSDAPVPAPAPTLADLVDVVYVAGPTDEALLRLLDAKAKDDASHRLLLDTPDTSVPASQDSPATFAYHSASTASNAARPQAPARDHQWRRLTSEFLSWLAPERSAWAHGTPYNGLAYFLVVSDATGKTKLRVFTSQAAYTPDLGTWQTLAQSAQPLSLSMSSAFFEENEIPIDGGPFVGGTFSFRIQ